MTDQNSTDLEVLSTEMLPAVETELQFSVSSILTDTNKEIFDPLWEMLAYHLGWIGEGAGINARGKRLRPLLVLLSTQALGGDWKSVLPAAAAIELIHNFSLIHDDIEDQDEIRRGRPTLWKKYGVAQALNAGDLMYTLAFNTLHRLVDRFSSAEVLTANQRLVETCVELTQGQYLDIAFETAGAFSMASYWAMVGGKTASLLSACTEIGAVFTQSTPYQISMMAQFGRSLGMAFQAQDDWLGIWGESKVTGKSTASDLVKGKKTLPVIYALNLNGEFAHQIANEKITTENAPRFAELLIRDGAQEFTQKEVERLSARAKESLRQSGVDGPAEAALNELTGQLLNRNR